MRRLKLLTVATVAVLFFAPSFFFRVTAGSSPAQDPPNRKGPALVLTPSAPPEAPAGFDNLTNGFTDQATFDADRNSFIKQETVADGVGPVYNAQSCGECHGNPISGGGSQILELRAGYLDRLGNFVEPPGDSLINERAVDPAIQERVPEDANVMTSRASLSLLGDGFIEAVADDTFTAISAEQSRLTGGVIHGQVIRVPVLEAPGQTRVGRFGWKNQHASLFSFSGDAYVNEMGITTPLFPNENTSMGNSVAAYDPRPDPDEGDNDDLEAFTRFIRATKVPPRDTALAATPEATRGERVFNQIGCSLCHTPSMVTAPIGASFAGGAFVVPTALGNRTIRPFGDFLLHDIGTGDGIVQNGGQTTAYKIRTAPLWGVRIKTRLMHDGKSNTFEQAILRHGGEAAAVRGRYFQLAQDDRTKLVAFLRSL
jgi:CxxC motif-containing protein (DUF1111 family)